MTKKSKKKRQCAKLERIAQEQSDASMTPAQKRFKRKHLAECEACRAEALVLDTMRFDGSSGPAAEWDDIHRHRWIDDVVEMSEREALEEQPEPARLDEGDGQQAGGHTWLRRWKAAGIIGAAAAGAAVIVAILVWHIYALEDGERPRGSQAKPPGAAVLLVSGEVSAGTADLEMGETLREGSEVRVREGRASLRLPDASVVLLEGRTHLYIRKASEREVAFELKGGSIVARVAPATDRRSFEVATGSARVRVEGTVFSVAVEPGEEVVSVHKGRVLVETSGRETVEVRCGSSVAVREGGSRKRRLEEGEVAKLAKDESLMSMLSEEVEEGARLRIETEPRGAEVLLDGTAIGSTPMVASVQPGFRTMTIEKRGYSPVKEGIELTRGRSVEREFALSKVGGGGGRPGRLASAHHKDEVAADGPKVEPRAEPRAEVRESGERKAANPRPRASKRAGEAGEHPAKTMLKQAQRASAARRFDDAVKAYRRLIRRHPSRPESRPALVSMGRILLGPLGKPAAALRAFDRYLSRSKSGTLAQEASYGRIRALRALGKRQAELKALRSFLKRFPGAIQKESVENRLRKLTGPAESTERKGAGSAEAAEADGAVE